MSNFIKKHDKKTQRRTTSVNLDPPHLNFIKQKHLNLSSLVREMLDAMIRTPNVEKLLSDPASELKITVTKGE